MNPKLNLDPVKTLDALWRIFQEMFPPQLIFVTATSGS